MHLVLIIIAKDQQRTTALDREAEPIPTDRAGRREHLGQQRLAFAARAIERRCAGHWHPIRDQPPVRWDWTAFEDRRVDRK
jgi:hypothetical protein